MMNRMTHERLLMSLQAVKENIAILESQEPEDAGYFLQLEHERHILDLLEAEVGGRLVVLPCKVGDTVWLLEKKCKHAGEENKPWNSCDQYWNNVRTKGMWGCAGRDGEGNTFHCVKREMVRYAKPMAYSLILYAPHIVPGKNLFLTLEEAEAALKGSADDA